MKIFLIYNNSPEKTLSYNKPQFLSLPDTALLKDSRPFFVPDFTQHCTRQLSLVVRISRLGKSISPRFARRYWDAVTIGVPFTAKDMLEHHRKEGLPWTPCCGFDGATAIGKFISTEKAGEDYRKYELSLLENGDVKESITLDDIPFSIEEIIAHLSYFHTMRQGDLIFIGTWGNAKDVTINTRLSGTLNGEELISFNVK